MKKKNIIKKIKQSAKEIKMLDELYDKKSKVKYSFTYFSSSFKTSDPQLGTVEADAAGRFGRWKKENFRAEKLAILCSTLQGVKSILDIGGGNLVAASFFAEHGFEVDVSDYSSSPYFSLETLNNSGIQNFYDGDFNKYNFEKKYDLIWISHVLEHQENIKLFLDKVVTLVNDKKGGGYIAIAVPPRKPFIVSGHVNLFNPGLLVYRLVLSGVDCSKAKVFQYDSNICLLVKLKMTELPPLNYDIGDIAKLTHLFPNSPNDGFNGDFMHTNLTSEELKIVYGIY